MTKLLFIAAQCCIETYQEPLTLISPTRDLATLVKNMCPTLSPDIFVFVTFLDPSLLERVTPRCLFQEEEGISAILERIDAEAAGFAEQSYYRMITLCVNSDLQAVGFLATVTSVLANENIPCNAVSAFHHDYLFVPEASAIKSMQLLKNLMASGLANG
jgi:hypothetical protein